MTSGHGWGIWYSTQGFTLGCRVVPLRGWAASGARCTTLKRVSAEELGPQPVSSLALRVSMKTTTPAHRNGRAKKMADLLAQSLAARPSCRRQTATCSSGSTTSHGRPCNSRPHGRGSGRRPASIRRPSSTISVTVSARPWPPSTESPWRRSWLGTPTSRRRPCTCTRTRRSCWESWTRSATSRRRDSLKFHQCSFCPGNFSLLLRRARRFFRRSARRNSQNPVAESALFCPQCPCWPISKTRCPPGSPLTLMTATRPQIVSLGAYPLSQPEDGATSERLRSLNHQHAGCVVR